MQKIPPDLQKVLTSAKTKALWNNLTPIAHRDFISWIESAKLPETRKRRIDRVPGMLASGKRRPCCYAVVPMNLYSALNGTPKAKAIWKDLSPDERRDFVDWIDTSKDSTMKAERITKTCIMLGNGKRRP